MKKPDLQNKVDFPEDDDENHEIICICGMRHDDGFTVQCDTCGNWQHKICYYPTDADHIGVHHYCSDCQPRSLDEDQAKERQMKHMDQNQLKAHEEYLSKQVDMEPDQQKIVEKAKLKLVATMRGRLEKAGYSEQGIEDIIASGEMPSL